MWTGIKYRLNQARARTAYAFAGAGNYARLRLRQNGHRPAIAAVMVGRNDDYMSDFRERLEATLTWNTQHLVDEVVFVEWNPPPERELLSLQLARKFPTLRAFVVPPEIHATTCANENVKLLEYHAKNVGIRRAQSPWILVTNADAAVGFDAITKIVTEGLEPDGAWTAQRIDIPWKEDKQREIGLLNSLRYRRMSPYQPLGTGEFCLASRELWHRSRGYDELMVRHRFGCDIRGTAQLVAHGGKLQYVGTVLHLTHPTSCSEKIQPHHGEWATAEGVPYNNPDDWGLGSLREVEIGERVWRLE